jgi:hypothetical protein
MRLRSWNSGRFLETMSLGTSTEQVRDTFFASLELSE